MYVCIYKSHCEMVTAIKLINTLSPHTVTVIFLSCLWWEHIRSTLGKFLAHSSAVTMVTVLHAASSKLRTLCNKPYPQPVSPHFCDHLFTFSVNTSDSSSASYTWNHAVFVLLWLASFTKHNALQVHPCCYKWQDFLLFKGSIIFQCVRVCLCVSTRECFIRSSFDTDVTSTSWLLWIMLNREVQTISSRSWL